MANLALVDLPIWNDNEKLDTRVCQLSGQMREGCKKNDKSISIEQPNQDVSTDKVVERGVFFSCQLGHKTPCVITHFEVKLDF